MPVISVPVNMVTDDLGDQTHRQGSSKPLRLGVSLAVIFKICRCRRHNALYWKSTLVPFDWIMFSGGALADKALPETARSVKDWNRSIEIGAGPQNGM